MPQTWNVGDTILDLYRVIDILGEGGFGKVYKVRHQGWNLDLAMKIPKPEIISAAGGVEGFEQEAETWVNLGLHAHIVSCYYVRRIDTAPAVFAEYLAGGSLHDWIRSRRLYTETSAVFKTPLQRLLNVAIQSAWGLHYAHEQGLVHQDVKPENMLLTSDGAVKITDFGIATTKTMARMFNGVSEQSQVAEGSTLMVTGSGAMTPSYCSPEQANRGTLTRRSDIWSWALSVLEMFQGERTWSHGVIANQALINYIQVAAETPQLPQKPQMPTLIVELLQQCFRQNPDERPHDLLTVARELQAIYQQVMGESYPYPEPKVVSDAADSLNNRAVSLFDLGRQSEALQIWEQSLKLEPQHLETIYNQGITRWRLGLTDDTALLKVLEATINTYPGDWRGNYLLALVHLERDDCETAITLLEGIQEVGKEQESVQVLLNEARQRLLQSRRYIHTFIDHTSYSTSVSLSTDGRLALTGGYGGTLNLWDLATGQCLRNFMGHKGRVFSVCFSADGQLALSGSANGAFTMRDLVNGDDTLKLWDIATGECLRTFTGHTDCVTSVCFNAGGQLALSGSHDNTLKLWDVVTGECLHTMGHADCVTSVCFTTDGRLALSGSWDKTLKLWDMKTGKCLQTFIDDIGKVFSVCLNADGRFALSGSYNNTLKIWDVVTGKCLRTFGNQWALDDTNNMTSVCLSADGRFALSGSYDNTLKVWDVVTGKCLRTLVESINRVDYMCVNSVCLSADGRFALSGGDGRTLKLWEFRAITNLYSAPMQLSTVLTTETSISLESIYERELALAYMELEKKDHIAVATYLKKARAVLGFSRHPKAFDLWTNFYIYFPRRRLIQGWEDTRLIKKLSGSIFSVCLSTDGRLALAGSDSSYSIELWEVATGKRLRTVRGGEYVVGTSFCFSANGQLAICGKNYESKCFHEAVAEWDFAPELIQLDLATGQRLHTFEVHGNVTSVCLSADERFALGSVYNTLGLWDVATGKCMRTFTGHTNIVTSVCLSADERFVLSGSDDKTLKLWDVATGKCMRTFTGHTGIITSVCLSADGQFALSGSSDHTLQIWDVVNGRCFHTFTGHTGAVRSVCYSADGRFTLSGSNDHTVKIWEVSTEQCLRTFIGHTDCVTSVCLSADSRFVLSGSNDGTIRFWHLDWELEDRPPADWVEDARIYLENFLVLHTPYAATLPTDREPIEEEITLALTRRGIPAWTEEDFQNLLYTLGCAGYGWLRPEGVRQQLEVMKLEILRNIVIHYRP
jgi:WD40 repeat protein/serine/threonine protein kinase